MEIIYLSKAMLMGLLLAMPVGPLAILCINRTIKSGFKVGFVSGLGVSTVDGLYAFLSFLGFGVIVSHIFHEIIYIKFIGISYLIYLGYKIFTSKLSQKIKDTKKESLIKNYISTFIITITNPLTIMSFTALFIAMMGDDKISSFMAVPIFLAVFLGSAIWHFILCFITHLLKSKIAYRYLSFLNKLSGILIIALSIIIIINSFKKYVL